MASTSLRCARLSAAPILDAVNRAAWFWVGCSTDQLQRVSGVQIRKALSAAGKKSLNAEPLPEHMAGAVLDQALMSAGGQLDRLSLVGVPSDRSVVRPVQAHNLGQQMSIGAVGLRPEVE